MNFIKKALSLVLSMTLIFSVCSFTAFQSSAAKAQIKSLEIKTLPTKLKFYRGTDWDYGIWSLPDSNDETNTWVWQQKNSTISFLHNPGSGIYPERGMIDMSGLEIVVKYTDSTEKTIRYKESATSKTTFKANILVSPSSGKEFALGKNSLEVYLEEDYRFYDTYDIEIINSAPPKRELGDINNDGKINSTDALKVLSHSVGESTIPVADQAFADMNKDKKINSTDALLILRIAVGF